MQIFKISISEFNSETIPETKLRQSTALLKQNGYEIYKSNIYTLDNYFNYNI